MNEDTNSPRLASPAAGRDQVFTIYPAIDLRHGQVVRLVQGDPKRQTIYGDDPVGVARGWLEAGARWLHVVNLDGAFGEVGQANLYALAAILEVAAAYDPPAQVQFGGGLRSPTDVTRALTAGVNRLVLGSMAVEAPESAAEAFRRFGPERVALGVDVRQGYVRTRGWTQSSGMDPISLGRRFYKQGLRVCIYTEISRDGKGTGIDVQGTQRFAQASGLRTIASGGVASLEDVRKARQAGLSGVIIGRALYEGQVKLEEALKC